MPAKKPGKGNNNGGNSPVSITGTDGADIIGAVSSAGVSDDTTSGDDLVYAGAGNDIIYGYAGDDELHGEGDDDLIMPGTGEDTVYGGTGVDVVTYDFVFTEEPEFKDGKGKNAGSVQITYTYEQDGQLITETDTLWDVEHVLYSVEAPGGSSGVVLDIESDTTGLYYADTALGSGIVALSDSGFYLLATTTAGGGGLEDVTGRIEDQDLSGDDEFRISTDADGTTHEINVQSAFDLTFDFVSFEVEGLDGSDQVLVSIASKSGPFSTITVLQVDATAAAADGVIEASELVGLTDANGNTVEASDFVDIDQLMIEAGDTAGDDIFWVDNLEFA